MRVVEVEREIKKLEEHIKSLSDIWIYGDDLYGTLVNCWDKADDTAAKEFAEWLERDIKAGLSALFFKVEAMKTEVAQREQINKRKKKKGS